TSSAGIEAGLTGVPVIELIPEGSLDLLPAPQWGTFGTARDQRQLQDLLHAALSRPREPTGEHRTVLAALGQEAARPIVSELLTLVPGPRTATMESSSFANSAWLPARRPLHVTSDQVQPTAQCPRQ